MSDQTQCPAAESQRRRRVVARPPRGGNSCQTCRLRKIRCDEQRPICNRCSSADRKCQWGSWVVTLPNNPPRLAEPDALQVFQHSLEFESPRRNREASIGGREAMVVEFFASSTRFAITEQHPQNPLLSRWADYLMASSVDEPAIRYAIAALGCVHQGSGKAVHTSLQRPIDKDNWQLTVELYLAALFQLQQLIRGASQQKSLVEPVLACCAVIFILELYIGNDAAAVRHSRFGRRIMQQHLKGSRPVDGSAMQYVDVGLSLAGSDRLSRNPCAVGRYACVTAPQAEPGGCSRASSLPTLAGIGERMEALIHEGNAVQSQLLDIAARRLEQSATQAPLTTARRYCLIRTLSRCIPLDNYSTLKWRLREVLEAHEAWGREAQTLLQARGLSPGLIMLQLRYFISQFHLKTSRLTKERAVDQYHAEYVRSLDLVEAYFAHQRMAQITRDGAAPVLDQPHNVGLFDFAVISALLLIATKSRTSAVRRRAIDVLRCARQTEGVHAVEQLQILAATSVRLEEEQTAQFWQMDTSQPGHLPSWSSEQVPEQARFSDLVLALDEDDAEGTCVVCAYSVRAPDGSIRLLETTRSGDDSISRNEALYPV